MRGVEASKLCCLEAAAAGPSAASATLGLRLTRPTATLTISAWANRTRLMTTRVATIALGWLLVVLPALDILDQAFLLAELLKATEHLLDGLATTGLDTDRHLNSVPSKGFRLPSRPLDTNTRPRSSGGCHGSAEKFRGEDRARDGARVTSPPRPTNLSCPPLPLIIDTYNVLHVTGVLPGELAVGEPESLAKLIAGSRFAGDAVWLVCDGVPRGALRVGRIVIEGAGPGRSADDHIIEFLARNSAPRRVTVVTSDRGIVKRAKARGAECVKSEVFLAMLAEDARKTKTKKPTLPDPRRSVPLNGREVSGWMALFGITAEQAAIQASARTSPHASTHASGGAEPPLVKRTKPSTTSNAALEAYLDATKDLVDPLSILDGREGVQLLDALGGLDDATLDALMKAHEPAIRTESARKGSKRKVGRRHP